MNLPGNPFRLVLVIVLFKEVVLIFLRVPVCSYSLIGDGALSLLQNVAWFFRCLLRMDSSSRTAPELLGLAGQEKGTRLKSS